MSYKITEDGKYIGIDLEWDCKKRRVHLHFSDYIHLQVPQVPQGMNLATHRGPPHRTPRVTMRITQRKHPQTRVA